MRRLERQLGERVFRPASGRAVRSSGFTPIELMIVVAIVGILAAVAVPAYNDSVRKSRRGQAKADLVELAQRAERFHTVNNTYAGFWASVEAVDRVSPRGSAAPHYVLTRGDDSAPAAFTFSAQPQGSQTADTRCMTLTLGHTGVKGRSGSSATVQDCW